MSLNKILILQKKVLHMMYFMGTREHEISLFINADILPVIFMYSTSSLVNVAMKSREIACAKQAGSSAFVFQAGRWSTTC